MIDIHHHCLPGVDDGPSNWDDAVEICRLASEAGIETIVATPHVLRGPWQNDDRRELQKLTMELNHRLPDTPRVILGSEYYFSHDILELLDDKRGIIPLAGGRHLLIEFPSMSIPPRVENVFHEIVLRNWIPIIAHPERNFVFQQNLEALVGLIRVGARVQLTASSLEGQFGPAAKRAALGMLDREMAHFVATDAHSLRRRPPTPARAREIIEKKWGDQRAQALFVENPRAVLEQRELPYEPEPTEPKTSGYRSIFGRLFN